MGGPGGGGPAPRAPSCFRRRARSSGAFATALLSQASPDVFEPLPAVLSAAEFIEHHKNRPEQDDHDHYPDHLSPALVHLIRGTRESTRGRRGRFGYTADVDGFRPPGRALVRRPGPRLAEGLVTYRPRERVDLGRARLQWEEYVASVRAAGWEVVEVSPADACPDAVFVEDTVVMHGDLGVLGRPGVRSRRGEVAGTEATLRALGYRRHAVAAPATLEGGDVLKTANKVYVGRTARTNDAGIRQLAAILEPRGVSVVSVPIATVLHLKSAATALPDGTIVGYRPAFDDVSVFDQFLEVPEEAGAHVVDLGGVSLLMSRRAPRSAELLARRGYRPVLVDIGEFEKLEGSVTCLSVRIRHAPSAARESFVGG